MSDAYLSHWGIKGMHWGVRRFQNQDGTWTSAGKARRAQDMSDTELRDSINRMRLEDDYNRMMANRNPKKESRVKKVMADILESTAKSVVQAAVQSAINKATAKEEENTKKKKNKKYYDSLDLSKATNEEVAEASKFYANLKVVEKNRDTTAGKTDKNEKNNDTNTNTNSTEEIKKAKKSIDKGRNWCNQWMM